MPWTSDEFKEKQADLTEAEARDGAAQANAILRSCLAGGGKKDECERIAIATALGAIAKKRKGHEAMLNTSAVPNDTCLHATGKLLGQILENGLLKVRLALTKPKVYEYESETGGVSRELLPESEVLSEEFLKQCRQLPITLDHPEPGPMVTADNIQEVLVGLTGSDVIIENKQPVVDGLIWRKDAIEAIRKGLDEVSIGFQATVESANGEYEGEPYEKVQRNVQLNHVAVGLAAGQGRCGRECVIMTKTHNVPLAGSYEQKLEKLMLALKAKYPGKASEDCPIHVSAVYDDRVIFADWQTSQYYEAPYSVAEDGTVTLGEIVKGTLQFIALGRPTLAGASGSVPVGAGPSGTTVIQGDTTMELNVQGIKLNLEDVKPEELKRFQDSIDKLSNEHADLVMRARTADKLNAQLEAKIAVIETLQTKCKEFEGKLNGLVTGQGLDTLVSEKLGLIREAESKIKDYQFKGKSNATIMADVIKSISPNWKYEGQDENIIREVYHALLQHEAEFEGPHALKSIKAEPGPAKSAEVLEWREKIKGRSAKLSAPMQTK